MITSIKDKQNKIKDQSIIYSNLKHGVTVINYIKTKSDVFFSVIYYISHYLFPKEYHKHIEFIFDTTSLCKYFYSTTIINVIEIFLSEIYNISNQSILNEILGTIFLSIELIIPRLESSVISNEIIHKIVVDTINKYLFS